MENALKFMFPKDDAIIHFAATQNSMLNDAREHVIFEADGEIIYAFADNTDEIHEEVCATVHQAYAHLIRNLNVPL